MARNLLIKEFNKEFKSKKDYTTSDIKVFYRKHIKGIKDSTIGWNVYHLVLQGEISRIKIGHYKNN